jgi:hypothetical protein
MAGKALAKNIADWELINNALKPNLTEMPYLNDKSQQLDGLIAQAKSLDAKQQDLRGSLQETVQQRRELVKLGRDTRSRIAAFLRGNLGFDNQTLLGFGVPPRRPRRKKTKTPTPAPSPVLEATGHGGPDGMK